MISVMRIPVMRAHLMALTVMMTTLQNHWSLYGNFTQCFCILTNERVMQNIMSLFSHFSSLVIHSTKSAGYQNIYDGKFSTANLKVLVPQCLDMCEMITIRCFFRKVWWYMDVYQCASLHII
jgi:hypothetical protein